MRNRWSIVRFAGHGSLCGCLRPRNLRLRNAVMGLLIAAFVLMGVSVSASIAPAYAVSASASPASALAYDAQEMAFLGLINDYRADHGRGPLVLSDQLSLTAGRHATDMAKYNFFAHETEQSDFYPAGYRVWDRLKADGYSAADTCGENLAAGMAEADRALSAWSGSSSHNENMLDPGQGSTRTEWRAIGIARVENPETGVWYWATTFGRVADAVQAVQVAEVAEVAEVAKAQGDGGSYADSVKRLAGMGIMDGYGDGSYGLGDPVMRQQFAKLVLKTMGLTPTESDVSPFQDVNGSGPDRLYPDNYVALAYERGITKGKTDDLFCPWDTISRAQVITMVVRAADSGRLGGLNSPPNGYSSTWGSFSGMHAPNAAVAEYNGLLDGLPLTTLDPWGAMPRGEVAQVLDNLSR